MLILSRAQFLLLALWNPGNKLCCLFHVLFLKIAFFFHFGALGPQSKLFSTSDFSSKSVAYTISCASGTPQGLLARDKLLPSPLDSNKELQGTKPQSEASPPPAH